MPHIRFPWEHSRHEAQDLYWRMGVGQDLLASIHDELAALPEDARRRHMERTTPP